MNDQEIEVKFFVKDLGEIEARIWDMCARLLRPRVHEVNLRYDRPDGSLARAGRVLRLRQGDDARLTYKGPGSIVDGAMSRQEIEFTVGDFEATKAFLEALDYRIIAMYEKYRTAYALAALEVLLDELPYGNFVEIEGPDAVSIHAAADHLGLQWEAAIGKSYLDLFKHLSQARGFTFRDLSFANFADTRITAKDLDVCLADS